LHDDWSLLTIEERERKADEILQMLKDLHAPTYTPKPIEYRWIDDAEPNPAATPGGIGKTTDP
jgi:hypothetical protein